MIDYYCKRSALKFLAIMFGFALLASLGLIGCSSGGGEIEVPHVNVAPVITSAAPLNAIEGVKYSYTPVADDPGDTLTWTLTNAPGDMSIDPSTDVISWTPAIGVTSSGEVTLTVTDSEGLTDKETFTVSVSLAEPIVPIPPLEELSVRIISVDTTDCPNTVSVFLNVLDEKGALITDTDTPSFQVTDDGTPANVTDVEYKIFNPTDDGPLSISLILDASGSLTVDDRSTVENAAAAFVRGLSPSDAVEVLKFDAATQVMQSYTTDKDAAANSIFEDYDSTPGGGSNLYAAIDMGLDHTAPRTGRKAIVVLSDGNADDVLNKDVVIANAIADGIPVYTIGFGEHLQEVDMSTLAYSTGGIYYELSDTVQAFQSLQSLEQVLDQKIVVTFEPPNPTGQPHNISVKVTTVTGTGEGLKDVIICP